MPNRALPDREPLRIVFCTTCMNRVQHLKETLPKNLEHNHDYENAFFALLDYGDKQGLQQWIKERFEDEIEEGRLTYFRNSAPRRFHMTHAKNMAHRCGMIVGADILVNLDADNYTTGGFATYLSEVFAADEPMFMRSGQGADYTTRGIGGRIAVKTADFCKIGGYDEIFDTWSPDDKDISVRLKKLGAEQVDIDPAYLEKISHSDEERIENYAGTITTDDIKKGGLKTICDFSLREHILRVNSSGSQCHAGCGVVHRNFSEEPITIPTFSVEAESP